MGRRKIITDKELIGLVDTYFSEQCEGDVKLLKTPLICEYIRKNGYPSYQDYILRRNKAVMEHINQIKTLQSDEDYKFLSAYKTIDVEEFVSKNHGVSAMKRALTELDSYYKSVSDKATKICDRNRELESLLADNKVKIMELNMELESSREEIEELKNSIKALTVNNGSYREIIDTYVYPEIANELLKQSGLLQNTNGIIKVDAVKTEVIHPDTPIKSQSNIIQGLFDRIEE